MSDIRADLKSCLAAAVQAAGEAQAACSIITSGIDVVDGALEALAEQQQAAAAMTIAAVGASGEGQKDEAAAMLSAASRLGELIIEIRESASLIRMRAESAHRIAGTIASNGQSYSSGI